MKVTIEFRNDLPVPVSKRGRLYRFPFDQLEVGQCFIVRGMNRNTLGPYKRYAELNLNKTFVTKKTGDGVGVWRTM